MNTSKVAFLALAIIAGVGVAAATPASTPGVPFVGRWRVAGVAVSSVGVQALFENDPSLMGRSLTFTPGRLVWNGPPVGDVCDGLSLERLAVTPDPDALPQLRRLRMRRPVAYAVRCASGHWGPDGTVLYRGSTGDLAMPWYDGGLLKLVRR